MGPTPPGTGVIALTLSLTSSKSTSPTILSAILFIPTSIIIESFIVTVIGGMGSISGAFLASLIIGMARSFGAVAMPLFTDGLMFMIMVLVLILRPQGLMGKKK